MNQGMVGLASSIDNVSKDGNTITWNTAWGTKDARKNPSITYLATI